MKGRSYSKESLDKQVDELYEKLWVNLKPMFNNSDDKPVIVDTHENTKYNFDQPSGKVFYLDYEFPIAIRVVKTWSDMEKKIEDDKINDNEKRIFRDLDPFGEENWNN